MTRRTLRTPETSTQNTHRREKAQAQARVTSITRQAEEGTTTLEGKQEYADRRAEGRDLDSGNISDNNTGQGVDSEGTGQLPIITPEHQKNTEKTEDRKRREYNKNNREDAEIRKGNDTATSEEEMHTAPSHPRH